MQNQESTVSIAWYDLTTQGTKFTSQNPECDGHSSGDTFMPYWCHFQRSQTWVSGGSLGELGLTLVSGNQFSFCRGLAPVFSDLSRTASGPAPQRTHSALKWLR